MAQRKASAKILHKGKEIPSENLAKPSRNAGVWITASLVAACMLWYCWSASNFPVGTHADEEIVSVLTLRSTQGGGTSANWQGLWPKYWWSRPTLQFSPYSLWQIGVTRGLQLLTGFKTTEESYVLVARRTSCCLGAIGVLLSAWAALGVSRDPRVGIAAAVLMGTMFVHVTDSLYARVEAFLNVVILLCLGSALRALQKEGRAYWEWSAAFFAGVVVATKYNAAPILIVLAFLVVHNVRRPLSATVKHALLLLVLSFVGFVVATPEMCWSPSSLWDGMTYEFRHYMSDDKPFQAFPGLWWDRNFAWWPHYMAALGIGWIPLGLAIAGAGLAIARRRSPELLLAAYSVAGIAVIAWPKVRYERNLEIVAGPLAILAAIAVVRLSDLLTGARPKAATMVYVAALTVAIVQPVLNLGRFKHSLEATIAARPSLPIGLDEVMIDPLIGVLPPPDADRFILFDVAGPYYDEMMPYWRERFRDWNWRTFDNPWLQYNYPFSTLNIVHFKRYHVITRTKPR